ncbi:MAG: Transcription-repair-coupling factor [Syntrophorhabdaceae bacterium PtaU1.Bin034]|nr:MAG: Transcription-repair-coupling factor [Syntrophorhabdaceae bacterium PtaU1.Bin034]
MYPLPDKGFIYITGKIESFISLFVSQIQGRRVVVFYESEDEALLLKEEMEFFAGREVSYFPVYSHRIFEREDEAKRLSFLYRLTNEADFIGLFPLAALDHPLFPPRLLREKSFEVEFGQTLFQEKVVDYLYSAGYEPASLVREQGEFARRGAIMDVFPPSSPKPIRIELLGDEVYSLRLFDPVSQRSQGEIERCILIPARLSPDGDITIMDYLPENGVVVHKGLDTFTRKSADDQPPGNADAIRDRFLSLLNIDVSGIKGDEEGEVLEAVSNKDLREIFEARRTEIFRSLTEKLKGEWSSHPFVYLFAANRHQGERLQEILRNYDIALPILNGMSLKKEKEWGIVIGPLRRGFRTKSIIILTEEDIVGPKKRAVKQKWEGTDEFLNSFKDLTIGEYVVHVDNGIGVYKGIKKIKVGGCEKDFLLIEYQDEDKLYVPVDSLELVQKYIGGEKSRPKIDKLGAGYWKNAKKKVKKYVEDIAKELIQFYAERELAKGHAFPPDDELFREMEERFEYEETEGQTRVIREVLDDLMRERPMDRVVCGDVGFGKTEVAIRASFKAMIDNKQVALLVPTTVLAQQHYKTFSERFKDYPVTIEMLSRFRSREEQARSIEQLKKGGADMVIGTHRLLQKDVQFKDLGLLIVDEEHRFGVKHKEKLKLLKKNVDVLTLSATPIPRTLHMAITGIKDLSIINTPPLDRLAVKTQVLKFNDGVIRKAVMDELQRGGQVFFVHNVIYNIGVVYEHLKKILPEVKMAVAHGRMNEKQLEHIMLDFIAGKLELLLSTNIIESGLDISNVNTIFINNAHRFGLADLYQLRGRVGRSTKQSYAYLLVPREEVLARDALTRLKIMEEMTELGSGLKVANYDLEIRGAGNLLGKEQSGHIDIIGFELYCRMLEEAVKELRNEGRQEEEPATEVNLPLSAFIPDSYIGDETSKLLTYKRLSKIKAEDELAGMEEELKDRYGPIPDPLRNLLEIISLKTLLTRMKVRRLEYAGKQVILHVTDHTPLDMKKILKMVKEDKGRVKLLPDGRIVIQNDQQPEDIVSTTRNVLKQLVAV